MYREVSPKNRTIALVLTISTLLLGFTGIQRLYVGRYKSGIAALLISLIPLMGIAVGLFDLFYIVTGRFKDKDGKVVLNWETKES